MSTEPTGTATPAKADAAEQARDFDVFRLRLGDAVALVAALALLFIMAGDWYSTSTGEEAREIEQLQGTEKPGAGLVDEGAVADARVEAEQAERNAWQLSSAFDLLVLVVLLATIALALVAAAFRAAGRSAADPGRSPSALAALVALVALLLVALQAALRLDQDSDATVQVGLPLGVAALGAVAFGAGLALREDRRAAASGATRADGLAPPREAIGAGGEAGSPRTYNRAP